MALIEQNGLLTAVDGEINQDCADTSFEVMTKLKDMLSDGLGNDSN